jgi:hypothetical protein
MRLFELAFRYNTTLNPAIWTRGNILKPEVREKLLEIAQKFIEFMDIDLHPVDIIITGSSANYNWTQESDLDLHLVIDKEKFQELCPIFTEDFFADKKTLWNEHHEISIYGLPVEVYSQDEKEPHVATGVYSILNDEWIVKPKYQPPTVDEMSVLTKTKQFVNEIDKMIEANADYEDAVKLKDKLGRYRRAGLQSGGEFSVENLVFKELRRNGYLGKLREYIRSTFSDDLSLP